jgi:hypothetical protein
MTVHCIEPKEALDLSRNLLRAESRPISPLNKEALVTRPRAEFFHLLFISTEN